MQWATRETAESKEQNTTKYDDEKIGGQKTRHLIT